MKNKIWILILVLSLAMNAGGAAMLGLRFVQTRNAGNSKGCFFATKDTYLYTLLGLSQEQLALITPLAHDFHEELYKLSSEIHEKRNNMIALMEQDSFDIEQVNLIRKDMLSIQSAIQQRVFEHILKMKQLLRPEQKEAFFKALRQSFISQHLNCNE